MKSNVCKIEKGTQDLAAILAESERVASYNGLSHKQSLQLRLLCEELDGMLPKLIDDFEGLLWITYDAGVCEIHLSIKIPEFNADKKNELIAVAKNKKNAAAVGIVGKIRNAIENFFLDDEAWDAFEMSSSNYHLATGYSEGVNYSYLWSLSQYKNSVNVEHKPEETDELEKSVIAAVADDVIVAIKGKQAEITVIKKFA